jgi:hypothetical protein
MYSSVAALAAVSETVPTGDSMVPSFCSVGPTNAT